MGSKSSLKASLKALFKGEESHDGGTKEIAHALTEESRKLEALRSSGGLTDGQTVRYHKIQAALSLLQDGTAPPVSSVSSSDWMSVHNSCRSALAATQRLLQTQESSQVLRLHSMLQLQLDELQDLKPLFVDQNISALGVMLKLYDKAAQVLVKSKDDPLKAERRLSNLSSMLQEGPEYLVNLALLKTVEINSRLIDKALADEVRTIRRDVTKKKAAPDVVMAATVKTRQELLSVPNDRFETEDAAQAFQQIDAALDKLQARLGYVSHSPLSSLQDLTLDVTPEEAPSRAQSVTSVEDISVPFPRKPVQDRSKIISRPPVDSPTSKALASIARRQESEAPTSEQIPSAPRSLATPQMGSRSSPTPDVSNAAEPELYEYGGHILTRSALSLVMLQERMEHADSSGQYAGEVQWDPVRQTWIPVYIKPLQKSDVGEGEIPDRNPANFEIREEDEFGNRIGWSGDQIYYVDDPVFEIRRDD